MGRLARREKRSAAFFRQNAALFSYEGDSEQRDYAVLFVKRSSFE
jgi:hypothetical protein